MELIAQVCQLEVMEYLIIELMDFLISIVHVERVAELELLAETELP